jgi:predicted nucleic acid-binding Zn ribbon protein
MPFYDYYSKETGEKREVFHSMSETPEILDSRGNKMNIKISNIDFVMKKDGTRNKDWKTRYGGKTKKSDHTMTPEESAATKAKMDFKETKDYEARQNDPYHQFRDN